MSSTVQNRFEVGYQDVEQFGCFKILFEAERVARRLKSLEPNLTVYVFDRMARKKQVNLWHFLGGGIIRCVTYRP